MGENRDTLQSNGLISLARPTQVIGSRSTKASPSNTLGEPDLLLLVLLARSFRV
jgi:hypothetical protein